MRKPYFKKSHQAWYVNLDGRPVKLGKDKETAEKEYHRLMADHSPVTKHLTVCELLDKFLCWVEDNQAPRTYEWYDLHLQKFASFIGKKMRVTDLLPEKVDAWLKRDYFDASDKYKNCAVRAVSRAFNWGRKRRHIKENPVTGLERPAAESREVYITPEQWKTALSKIKPDDAFLDALLFLYETGCRPQELRIIQTHHWRDNTITLERKNSKGKKVRRVIRLNDAALAIVKKLAATNPEGPIFRNRRGKPWTATALGHAFEKIAEKLDFPFFAYAVRHTWCSNALMRGVDPISVSILMGHKDASMVMKVYSHLCQQNEFLDQKLKQATGSLAN